MAEGIDGFDEPFPSPFPERLPDGVFVTASVRWDGQGETPYLWGWEFNEQMALGLMDESEIAQWLQCYSSSLL